ncbi:hypothetical protein WD019_19100 [Fictibacillus sp. Mic-4]|uniref:hypothetical protein n=1 Tax=Fictibacillus TaxID=1329200 RepID=UPI00041AB1CE|nr:hypothetical protein [Fictibacillus gelatini]HAJ3957184.1 hypothetical protein [Escherichia coli]
MQKFKKAFQRLQIMMMTVAFWLVPAVAFAASADSPAGMFKRVLGGIQSVLDVLAPIIGGLALAWKALEYYGAGNAAEKADIKKTMLVYLFIVAIALTAPRIINWVVSLATGA